MNKSFIKYISTFLTVFILNSCITPSPKNNTVNIDSTQKSLNESKNFNVKNVETVPEQEIKVIERDADEDVTVNIKREFPKNSPMNIEDMEITPINRTVNVTPGLTQEQIKDARKSLIKQWRVWYSGLVKVLRSEVNKKFHDDNKKAKADYESELLKYRKGTTEYNNVVTNYKKETEERKKLQKDQRDQFRQAVKKDWQNIKDSINKNYPKNDKTFSVKFDPLTWFVIGAMAVVILGPIVTEIINNFTKNQNPQPPLTINDIPAKVNKDAPIEPETTVTPQRPADTKPVQTNNTTVTFNTSEQVKIKDDSMQKILNALVAANDIKVAIPFRLKDIFKAAGVTNYPNILSDCVEVPITDLSRLSTTRCADYIGVVSFKDLPNVEVQNTPEGKILMNFELSDKRIINATGGKTMSLSEWVISLGDKYLPSNWGEALTPDGIKVKDKIKQLSNKTLKFSLESPKVCNQGVKAEFSSNNIVSFQAEMAKNILFEGEYTYSLNYEDKTTKQKTDIKSGTINLMNYISGNNLRPEDRLSKKLNMLGRGMFDASTPEQQLPNSKFGYFITNQMGDLWDMKINRLGDTSCPPIYTSHCIDTKKADITFAKGGFDTGIYRLETRYNIYDTVKGVNTNQANTNYIDTLVTRVNYASFARLSDKVEQSEMYGNNYNNGGNNNIDQLSADSYGYYYDPSSNDNSDPEAVSFNGIKIPSDINSESAEYLKQLVSVPKWRENINLQEGNLLSSLASPNGTSPFKTSDINSCSKKYLHVGAVIDLTNKKHPANNYLFNKTQTIPVIVAIEKEGQKVRQFYYSAKLGQVNIVQSYWDGKIDNSNNEDLDDDDYLPDYISGQYAVKVYVDHEVLDRSYRYSAYNKLQNVIFTTPYISTKSSNAIININNSNDCPKGCLDPAIKTKLTENIDSMLAQSNDIKFDDMYAMASNFGIASVNVSRPIDIAQVDILRRDYYNLRQALEDLKKALIACNSQEISKKSESTYKIASTLLEYNRASLERIYSTVPPTGTTNGIPPQAPKTPQEWDKIKKVVELAKRISSFAKRSIILYLVSSTLDLISADANTERAVRNLNLAERIVELVERVEFIKAKTLTKECGELGFEDNLANIRFNARDIYNEVENYYILMKERITAGDGQGIINFEYMAPELENKINNANTKLNNLSAQLETECGENANSCDPNKKNLYVTKGFEFAYRNEPLISKDYVRLQRIKKLDSYLTNRTFGGINYNINSVVGLFFSDRKSTSPVPQTVDPLGEESYLNTYLNTAINRNTNKCILKYLNEVKNQAPVELKNIRANYERIQNSTRANLTKQYGNRNSTVISVADYNIASKITNLIANSGEKSVPGTALSPEENVLLKNSSYFKTFGEIRRFDVSKNLYPNNPSKSLRQDDAEVKIFEDIAQQFDVYNRYREISPPTSNRTNPIEKKNNSDGIILIYSYPKETCSVCRDNLFEQIDKVMPNVLIIPVQP